MSKKKESEHVTLKTSVKSYQGGISAETQKMADYAKKMGSGVRSIQGQSKSLQGEFKKHSKEMKEAGRAMIAEGNRNMHTKVSKFTGEIKEQIKENKEAVSHMENSIKLFLSEVNKKKKDFLAYQHGSFHAYIRAFWG